jgi:hypothetical protein
MSASAVPRVPTDGKYWYPYPHLNGRPLLFPRTCIQQPQPQPRNDVEYKSGY